LCNRATLLRRLAKLHIIAPNTQQQDTPEANVNITNEINHVTNILTIPPTIETTLHKPLRPNGTPCLPTYTSTPPSPPDNLENNDILTCYKEHCIATRLTIKHANRTHYNKYGSAVLQIFVRKPRNALKSILKTAAKRQRYRQHTAPTNLSSIRGSITRRFTSDPAQVKRIIEQLETKALSPNARINPRDPFPWHNAIPNNPPARKFMGIGKLPPAIFQEALRRLPNQKAPGPDNIPGFLLNHMPPAFHKVICQLF
jgi:hypothetical protein